MTKLERAAERIRKEPDSDYKITIFTRFVLFFNLYGEEIEEFAVLCGFSIATNVVVIQS